ncbi:hypothetical protein GCM10008018_09170 [Paenibacillus marchantiophytorum]|uniref:HTH marR-type domain-containing protein n=1 Tax=Paenibacillus marchantiophytorum TaxID=1619310 RepID=A0ABQ2BTT0_9BACL|nr:MarR family transcriptional regulator [Paenibacillus marchantiophytorum]GGI44853.1 hypothetical protein GCM10008018_09170 [Paenibacillus marchantiophytorum]
MINHADKQKKDRLIKEVLEAVKGIQHKYQAEDDEEKEWLVQNSPTPVIAELLKELTVMMLHVLDAIGKLEPVNGITISKQFGFSKGNVSKITRKLLDKQIIVIEYLPDNKKEILFRTTSLGKEIYRLHLALHQQIDLGVNKFLQRYNEDELQFLVTTLHETLHASWIHSESNSVQDTDKLLPSVTVAEEMNEVMAMLNKLDSRNLRKAKAILNDVFFTEYED